MKDNRKEKRFERTYTQGGVNILEIWVDRQTGVNYMYRSGGYGGGLTPLLDSHGNVIVTRVEKD